TLLDGRFGLVTAFRFFLNAEPDLRRAALQAIEPRLAPGGYLVANFHLNPTSLTGLYVRLRSLRRARRRPMMSLDEARALLTEQGFEVEQTFGYGYLLHRGDRAR